MREKARQEMPLLLVHVKASIKECEKRDPKGLYKQAREGKITNFVPFDIPFEEPKNTDIVLDTETSSPGQCVDIIVSALQSFDYAGNGYVSYEDIYLTNIQRNRSLIKTTASVMAVICAVLSAYFMYSDIFLTVPTGVLSYLPKLFVSIVMAISTLVISYHVKTFTKSRAKLQVTQQVPLSKQTLYNRIILIA
ncbi:MAG: adenylyl-sulfate kinase [Thaumarchaeota archaeon]|nr:adenylyl-sulfate kinase [Nitrososphaerota archaeon]